MRRFRWHCKVGSAEAAALILPTTNSANRNQQRNGHGMTVISRRSILFAAGASALAADSALWNTFKGKGKRIVLISGDEEYRSEEGLSQLGKILSTHHGFHCTVLYAIDPATNFINPEVRDNILGLEALRTADLMIILTRFRELPDEQMHFIDEYVHSGRPIIGLRTATHAFDYKDDSTSNFRHYGYRDKSKWPGGFGKQVLGETWISHHGHHAVQSTRGVIAPEGSQHPIIQGCENIWGPSDVYTVTGLPPTAQKLVMGQVLQGMNATDKPVEGDYEIEQRGRKLVKRPNDPMMPVAWTNTFATRGGKTARVFTTTMGASTDLANEGLRRLVVNAVFWSLKMEPKIGKRTKVDLVGLYQPTAFGFGKHLRDKKPSDFS